MIIPISQKICTPNNDFIIFDELTKDFYKIIINVEPFDIITVNKNGIRVFYLLEYMQFEYYDLVFNFERRIKVNMNEAIKILKRNDVDIYNSNAVIYEEKRLVYFKIVNDTIQIEQIETPNLKIK